MLDLLSDFGATFVPLFVAMDAIGVLPFMVAFSDGLTGEQFNRMVRYAIFTALGLGLAFLVVGKAVFSLMGIEVRDFLIGGGIILFLISAKDLVVGRLYEGEKGADLTLAGAVPIGVPLLVGPAVLTTLLLLIDRYPTYVVVTSFVLNLAVGWVVISQMRRVVRFLGQGGIKVTSKVAALLLAAIAIKMIRQGVVGA